MTNKSKKNDRYNFKFIYCLNGKEITKDEAIQHVVDMQKKRKEKSA